MSAAKAIYNILTNNAPVNTAVGGRITDKYPTQNPTLPCIVYKRTTPTRAVYGLEGEGAGGKRTLTRSQYSIDLFHNSYPNVEALYELVRAAFKANQFGGTFGGVSVQAILFLGCYDVTSESTDRGEENLVAEQDRISMEYAIWHRE